MTGEARTLSAARVFAAHHHPYLASAVFALDVRWVPGCGTVAVDTGWRLYADPEAATRLGPADLGKVVTHLVGHLLRDHAGRAERAGAAPDAWNVAADVEVNDDLVAAAVPPVAGHLPSDLGRAVGGVAEGYLEDAQRSLDGAARRDWDCGSGADGRRRAWDRDSPGLSGRDGEWLRVGVAAAAQRQETAEPGSVPAGWLRWAERMLPSKVDWRRILAAELRTGAHRRAGMVDYSYRRPSRRAASVPGVVLPTLERPVPEVAVVVDTSGSMGGDELAAALAEIEALVCKVGLGDGQLRVLSVDTAVHAVRRVSTAGQVALVGGGGTDMGAGITAAAGLRPRPPVVVVLTDGMTPWPASPPPGVRVVVALVGPRRAGVPRPPAWARVVEVEP